jgi:transcriptional regulator with XRE-family HTH domain
MALTGARLTSPVVCPLPPIPMPQHRPTAVPETARLESSGEPELRDAVFPPLESPSARHAPSETPSSPTPAPAEPDPPDSGAEVCAVGVVLDTVESFESDYPLWRFNVNSEFRTQAGCTRLLQQGYPHSVPWHIGKTVRLIRLIRDISQQDLAALTGLSTKTISRFEHGGAHDSHTIQAIANGLKVDYRQLVTFDIDMVPSGPPDASVPVITSPSPPATTGKRPETDMLKEFLWRVFQKLDTDRQQAFLAQMIRAADETPTPEPEA